MKLIVAFTFSIIFVATLILASEAIPYIINGTFTEKNELKYMAGIFVGKKIICGAAIIDELHLLTAGHCLRDEGINYTFSISIYTARVGEYDIRSSDNDGTEQSIKLEKYDVHPEYKKKDSGYMANDLAVITLKEPIIFNEAVQPIRLPKPGQRSTGRALAAGWGITQKRTQNATNSDILQKIYLPIVDDDACVETYSNLYHVNPAIHLCAGYDDEEIDTCKGDSGGPLVAFDEEEGEYLAGIISWGLGCAIPGYYGVNVRVSAFVNWIRSLTT